MNSFPVLTAITAVPVIAASALFATRPGRAARAICFVSSLFVLAMIVAVWVHFKGTAGQLQFEERYAWIPGLAVEYRLGIDGLGMLALLLTGLVVPMGILASSKISDRAHLYFGLILLLEAGLVGTFTALNFFHWFLFWELSLIPAFFLVRLWGGSGRAAAATQFFVYTMVGSVALLLAFLAIYLATGKFDLLELARMGADGTLRQALSAALGQHASTLVFLGILLGFAVKVPIMPFHSWLPITYKQAPVGTTMILTGVMSKMGVYGLLRILLPIFPAELQAALTPLLLLAVFSVIISASIAFAQRDLKYLLAYSSINHLGYCTLAIFAVVAAGAATPAPVYEKIAALNGAMLQMFNHGLTAAVLFWMAGLLEQKGGSLLIHDYRGLRKVAPVFCALMGIAFFSSLGLPGLNGFIGEFLIFKGVFPLASWSAALSVLGLLITAVFLLGVMQCVFHGPANPRSLSFPDLRPSERLMIGIPVALMLLLGVYPQLLIGSINATATAIVARLAP